MKLSQKSRQVLLGAERVLFLLGRLTVMRAFTRTLPVTHLSALCDAIAAGDAMEAVYEYHAMAAALLSCDARRVTGDIWKDFVFQQILEIPNRFSKQNAAGRIDPPLQSAMERDLALMQELFELESVQIQKQINELSHKQTHKQESRIRNNEKWVEREERVARMAVSAWGGKGKAPSEKKEKETPVHRPVQAELPNDLELEKWVLWRYDEPGEQIEYVADEALVLVYRRFLGEENWDSLAGALGEFHSQYGCGEFLRYRIFSDINNSYLGLEQNDVLEWDDIYGLQDQKEQLYANALRFIHTGVGSNTLLYGEEGMGKTSLFIALSKELPDLRVVFLSPDHYDDMIENLQSLLNQPFRFIVLLDDISINDEEYRRLKTAFSLHFGKKNVLICATSGRSAPDHSLFPLQIEFTMPTDKEFSKIVNKLAINKHINQQLLDESIEHYKEKNNDYSIRSAGYLVEKIARQQRQIS